MCVSTRIFVTKVTAYAIECMSHRVEYCRGTEVRSTLTKKMDRESGKLIHLTPLLQLIVVSDMYIVCVWFKSSLV